MTKQGKVLVVDAERHIVRLAQVNLERAGYQVTTAFDGTDALNKALSEKPDIIVLGTIAPPVDAADLLERLRTNEATKGIRVVALTGMAQDFNRV